MGNDDNGSCEMFKHDIENNEIKKIVNETTKNKEIVSTGNGNNEDIEIMSTGNTYITSNVIFNTETENN